MGYLAAILSMIMPKRRAFLVRLIPRTRESLAPSVAGVDAFTPELHKPRDETALKMFSLRV